MQIFRKSQNILVKIEKRLKRGLEGLGIHINRMRKPDGKLGTNRFFKVLVRNKWP